MNLRRKGIRTHEINIAKRLNNCQIGGQSVQNIFNETANLRTKIGTNKLIIKIRKGEVEE